MSVINQDTGVTEKYTTNTITLEEEATYHIYAFDKAGNYKELWIAIDKTDPTINVAGTNVDGYFRDEEVTLTVFDKFLTEEDRKALFEKADLKVGSVLFFIADKRRDVVTRNAGLIRTELGRKLDLMDHNLFEFCFITDMPMYEISEITGKLDFMHNPFSMPRGGMKALENEDPLSIYADQFDVVCNGVELVSGAVRNNRPEVLLKAFELAGYTEEDIKKKFSALYTAFKYGCPPHVGMALGIDRALMMLLEEDNVRETVAFPLNQNGEDVLTGTPNEVTELQLRETHIKLR